MKKYIKLCRVKHYIKNGLIFLPLLFAKGIFTIDFLNVFYGFIAFSLISSVVYIINDIKDIEKDRLHPIKKGRPLASNQIKKREALIIALLLFMASCFFNYLGSGFSIYTYSLLLIYLLNNILYSFGFKNIPLVDIFLLVLGFLIRIYYGALIIKVKVSNWLYLTVMSAAFFLVLGKRRNEIIKINNDTRKVLTSYNKSFLDKNMYMCLGLTITFYALWAIEQNVQYLIITIPLVVLIFMRYTMIIEGDSHGDPTDILLKDRALQLLGFLFGVIMLLLMR